VALSAISGGGKGLLVLPRICGNANYYHQFFAMKGEEEEARAEAYSPVEPLRATRGFRDK
jgi:hypothetical protein